MSSPPNNLSSSTTLSRVPSFLPKVPDFDDLPDAPGASQDIELDHITIEHEPSSLNGTTEIQLAYEEQRQNYEVEHAKDTEQDHKVCISSSLLLSEHFVTNYNYRETTIS